MGAGGGWHWGPDSISKERPRVVGPSLKGESLLLVPYKYEEQGKASGEEGELSDQ